MPLRVERESVFGKRHIPRSSCTATISHVLPASRQGGVNANFIQGHGFAETEPKTASSRRTIAPPHVAIDALKRHRTAQREAWLQIGAGWKEQGLVFTNAHGGYLGRSPVHKLFKKLLQEAGLPPMRVHDLRHSAATIL